MCPYVDEQTQIRLDGRRKARPDRLLRKAAA